MTTPLVATAAPSSPASRATAPVAPGRRRSAALYGGLLVVALLMPLQDSIYLVSLMKVLCFALFACAFNLLLGYAGLLSFGHAAFFGSAAYATAHVCKVLGAGPATGIVAGAAVASV